MLRCPDGSYYMGCTTNIDQRYGEHLAGMNCAYTSTRRPLLMVWAEEFQSLYDAIDAERRIKGWSRLKKEAMIRGDYEALPGLSRRGFRPAQEATRERSVRGSRRDPAGRSSP
ncbi:MAG: GIY-YIG nuclease family protein [Caulobacterales bacterium]